MLALALHHQGLSTREIGKRLCFDHTTIHRRIKNSKTPLPQIIEHLKTIDTLECGCGEHRIALASIINKAYAAD
ncbi:MAG: helix-turn-helix domain-containing protein [Firmicutes bacterium]|nr:helix-turn-helix domain-containing protein [Bacillota bacterium]